MAITATLVVNNPNYKSWTITALDADTTTTFLHGFASAPDVHALTPTISYAFTALPTWGISRNSTTITLVKQAATGSGGAVPGTTIIGKLNAMLPHSIIQ
jgi:hypothetical protein